MNTVATEKKTGPRKAAEGSTTEENADAISRLSPTDLRWSLPDEKRIKVLMIALQRLEGVNLQGSTIKAKQRLFRNRLAELCAQKNTAVTIIFQPGEKDFSEWDLNAEGFVIDSRPCQASVWCGDHVVNFAKLRSGGEVVLFTYHSGKIVLKHRIKALVYGPAAGGMAVAL